MNTRKISKDYKIFECIAGSRAYGTEIESSDIDVRGCFIAPPASILSCNAAIDQVQDNKQDEVCYELRKFMKLLAQNNPNIIELAWQPDKNILYIDWPFKKIMDNRNLFLSKKSRYSFAGYAHAQLKRIKGHEKWITNPKSETPPMLSEFCKFLDNDGNSITNSEEIKKYSQNLFLVHSFGMSMFRVFKSNNDFNPGWFNHDETDFKAIDISDEKLIERKVKFCGWLIVNFDEFKKQRKEWNGYWEWKRNRNIDRAKLEEQFNYDTKHAMHLIRLLNMCKEILTEGTVIVNRPDAAFLLDIRNGKYPYEWIVNYAEEKDKELEELYSKSTLQYSADYEKIDQLYMNIVMEYWEQKGLLKNITMTCSYPILYDHPIYAEAFQYSNSDDLPATVTLPLNWTCSPSGSFTTAYKNVLLCQSAGELIFADDLDSLQLRNDISHANYAIFWKTVGRVGTKFSIRTRRLNSSNYISFKVDFSNNNIELLSTINGIDTSIDYSSYDFDEDNNKVYDFSIWTLNNNIYAFINGSNVLSGTSSLLVNKHGMSLYVPSINSSDPLAFSHMVVYETRTTPEQSLNADDLLVQFRLMLKEQIECPTDRTWRTYRNARLAWEKYKDYGYPDEVWTNFGYPIKEPSSEHWFEIVDFIGLIPYITDQPDSASANTGDTVTLSVSATGSGTLSYQWRKNGVNISGAISSTYIISGTTSSDSGSYDVVITNSFGSVNSDTVVVTISSVGDLSSLIFYTIYAA